ncbi:MAG: hypothetical protein GXO47_03640 [Chlorobi bacterium]|nr:hypothetical protein [Chlorobiota bacterium]
MIISFTITYLGLQDAVTFTVLYNRLDLNNAIAFRIEDKKKTNNSFFPGFNFKGKLLSCGDVKDIKVSRGDFETHNAGQIIKVFKTESDEFITEYEIENAMMIHAGDKRFSFVFIPAIIFFFVGIISLFFILKNKKQDIDYFKF